jgi:hypothetical protein
MKKVKKVRFSSAAIACIMALLIGAGAMYVVHPLQTEVATYRAALYWANYHGQNDFFKFPVAMAWEGESFIMKYSNRYQAIFRPGDMPYFQRPDGTRAPHSFKITPAADVRSLKLENLVN